MKKVISTALILIVLDQALKFWIKTHMFLGQEFKIFDWFIIHFTENNGMAFGIEFGGPLGKNILTIFRVIVVSFGIRYIYKLTKEKLPNGALLSLGFIIGGAIGNIIDSIFYGVIFNDSYLKLASLMPEGGGYSRFLGGKVVDMFYFPIINTHFPSWMPFLADQHFIFFRPVFNIADAGISVGIFILIVFYRNFFK